MPKMTCVCRVRVRYEPKKIIHGLTIEGIHKMKGLPAIMYEFCSCKVIIGKYLLTLFVLHKDAGWFCPGYPLLMVTLGCLKLGDRNTTKTEFWKK